MKYRQIAIAGTFDHLHKGHKIFIFHAFKLASKVIIGLTSEEYVKAKIQNSNHKLQMKWKYFDERKEELETFLKKNKLWQRVEIVKIDDVYGPAAEENKIEALLVTADSRPGGKEVNQKRRKSGLPQLKLETMDLVMAKDGKAISSSRIRIGEINRYGRVLADWHIFGKKLPQNLRLKLKSPIGILIKNPEDEILKIGKKLREQIDKIKPVMITAVGDETVLALNKLKIAYQLGIVDFHVKRVRKHRELADLAFGKIYANRKVQNPAGHITRELVKAIKRNLKQSLTDGKLRAIELAGEEDLASLPAILLSPLGSLVLYGQPEKGVVAVETTLVKKEELLKLLENADLAKK